MASTAILTRIPKVERIGRLLLSRWNNKGSALIRCGDAVILTGPLLRNTIDAKLPQSLLAAACLALGLTATSSAQRPDLIAITPDPAGIRFVCRDPLEAERIRLTRSRPLAVVDGRALMFDQDPPILAPDYTGTIALRDFTVAGDVSSLQFQHVDGAVEVWQRERTDTVAGRMVSVFQPSWPASALDRAMAFTRWGWDRPEMLWGEVLAPAMAATTSSCC